MLLAALTSAETQGRYFLAGGLCASISHGLATPIDVVKTRVQAAGLSEGGAGGVAAVVRTLLREEGLQGLARGMTARAIKIGVGQAVIFGTYDAVRKRMAP